MSPTTTRSSLRQAVEAHRPAAMKPADWREAGSYFDFRGHRIFYRDEGSGPALLCIHGFPTASWDWHRVWPELTRRFRVIAADMLGFGFSAKPLPHPYNIHEQADLQSALLEHLGLSSFDLIAHDYGVSVAQEMMARSAATDDGTIEQRVLRSSAS